MFPPVEPLFLLIRPGWILTPGRKALWMMVCIRKCPNLLNIWTWWSAHAYDSWCFCVTCLMFATSTIRMGNQRLKDGYGIQKEHAIALSSSNLSRKSTTSLRGQGGHYNQIIQCWICCSFPSRCSIQIALSAIRTTTCWWNSLNTATDLRPKVDPRKCGNWLRAFGSEIEPSQTPGNELRKKKKT